MIETREQALSRITGEIEEITHKMFSGDSDPMDDMSLVYKLSFSVWEYLGNYLSKNGWASASDSYGAGKEDYVTIRTSTGTRIMPLFEYMSGATDQIFEKIVDCIKYYTPDKGAFINYFNRSFIKGHVIAELDREKQSGGMTYREADSYTATSEDLKKAVRREKADRMIIRQIHSFFSTHPHINPNEINIDEIFALFIEDTNISLGVKRFKVLFSEYFFGTPTSINHTVRNEDGDTVEVINMVADPTALRDFDEMLVNYSGEKENAIKAIFDRINEIFLSTGYETEKSRKIKKIFLTSELTHAISAGNYFDIVSKKDFFDKDIYSLVSAKGKKLLNKEIAEICGCSAANVSKITKPFWEEIKACFHK